MQINRDQGVGSTVLIDGLRQNSITLNSDVFLTGKEFYTYGEASGGGSGANIQYNSFSTIPSDQLGGVAVIKSPNAALTEGGIGGTIDLKTRNPLDSPDGFSGDCEPARNLDELSVARQHDAERHARRFL